jgi:hypothetical protein
VEELLNPINGFVWNLIMPLNNWQGIRIFLNCNKRRVEEYICGQTSLNVIGRYPGRGISIRTYHQPSGTSGIVGPPVCCRRYYMGYWPVTCRQDEYVLIVTGYSIGKFRFTKDVHDVVLCLEISAKTVL